MYEDDKEEMKKREEEKNKKVMRVFLIWNEKFYVKWIERRS